MAEIQRYLPGKVGEGWSTDEAVEPKAVGLKVTEEEANSAPGRGQVRGVQEREPA